MFSFRATESNVVANVVAVGVNGHVAISTKGGVVQIRPLTNMSSKLQDLNIFEQGEISEMKYSPDGNYLAIVTSEGLILVYTT